MQIGWLITNVIYKSNNAATFLKWKGISAKLLNFGHDLLQYVQHCHAVVFVLLLVALLKPLGGAVSQKTAVVYS